MLQHFHCSQLRVHHSGSYVSSAVDTKQTGSSCSEQFIILGVLLLLLWVGWEKEGLERCTIDGRSIKRQVLNILEQCSSRRGSVCL